MPPHSAERLVRERAIRQRERAGLAIVAERETRLLILVRTGNVLYTVLRTWHRFVRISSLPLSLVCAASGWQWRLSGSGGVNGQRKEEEKSVSFQCDSRSPGLSMDNFDNVVRAVVRLHHTKPRSKITMIWLIQVAIFIRNILGPVAHRITAGQSHAFATHPKRAASRVVLRHGELLLNLHAITHSALMTFDVLRALIILPLLIRAASLTVTSIVH